MKDEELYKKVKRLYHLTLTGLSFIIVLGVFVTVLYQNPNIFILEEETSAVAVAQETDQDLIKDGIHVRTGLIDAPGLMLVVNNCTGCHSSKLVTANRMNEERWNAAIKWMQETQGLWDLGENQEAIVEYLVSNYPVPDKGRRENLANIEWYQLEN